jgi:AhpD family alkylhydroperoxidase
MAGEKKPWYMQHSELGESFRQFYDTCNRKSVLDDKTRELLQLALACVLRCPHCTRDHLKGSLEAGASKQEVTETLLIAAQEGAGTQLSWLREAYTDFLSD